jgi:LAGLIDADG-like domain
MSWAKGHDRCKSCGTEEHNHKARGLCASCYDAAAEKRHKSHVTRRVGRHLSISITKEDLEQKYKSGLSLNDIARQFNCTRQYIHKLLVQHKIVRRTLTEARNLALEQGKISYSSNVYSPGKAISHERRHVNESFFKSWTFAMAYVLGVIYTDGCLVKPIGPIKFRVTVGQKEPELLEKVIALLNSNARLGFSAKRGIAGALYHFRIDNAEIYADLLRLGLTPSKSITLQFPEIPPEFLRHFIRGCWDGDGSVYWEGNNTRKPCASFVSGSRDFIEHLMRHLVDLGLPGRTIHKSTRSKNPSYYFRYTGLPCVKLYHLLYDGVEASIYLTRKHDRFKAIADCFDSKTTQKVREADAALLNELKNYTHNKSPREVVSKEED